MAITFDATSNSSAITPSSGVVTFAHTVAADADCLAVSAMARDDTVSTVTYNGVSMTKQIDRTSADSLYASIWTLLAPATGTNNVVVTCGSTGPSYAGAVAMSFKGVAQSSFIDDTDATETTGANPTLPALTTVTDGCVIVDAVASNYVVAPTMEAETNRVERASFLANAQGRGVGASTIITKSPAGAVTMGWGVGGNNSAYVALALKPATGGGSTGASFPRWRSVRR